MKYHEPVLLQEVIEHLKPKKGKKFIDCTLGDGGHSLALLERGADVLGLDVDKRSLDRASKRIAKEKPKGKFKGVIGNFKDIDDLAKENGFDKVDGILYDLGYSSYQLDDAETGLSFQKDEPLDMRLDSTLGVTAADLLNSLSEKELTWLIYDYSGEKYARRFAKAIVKRRDMKKFQTTAELAQLLESESPSGYEHGRIHPATRTFQALRIVVNDELNNLKASLPRAESCLLPGGLLAIVSFHSLEDKVAKQFGQSSQPTIKEVTDKPIVPSEEEVKRNVRARSAKLRVFEKR